jgi:hypothetical protein
MKGKMRFARLLVTAFLSFLPLAAFSQSLSAGPTACKGAGCTVHPKASTTKSQTMAERQSNLYDCGNGWKSCDPATLTQPEIREVAAAEHLRNYTACSESYSECDLSRLTPKEARSLAAAQRAIRR